MALKPTRLQPLIGREGPIEQLRRLLLPPYDESRAVLIEGPAGIGKTSLLRAGVAMAEAAGAMTLFARPVETEVTFAYATLGELLGGSLAADGLALSPLHRQALDAAIGAGDDGGTVERADVELDAQRVGLAVLALWRSLAPRGTLLIAIDDAQWTDQASRDALAFAIRRSGDLRVQLLIVRRAELPGEAPPFALADAARPMSLERLWLEPLSMGALHQLLRTSTGTTFTRPVLLRIHSLSGGNPFFALELARALAAQGATLRPGQDLPVPRTLRELLGARLQPLSPPTRRLLLTAGLSTRPTVDLLRARAGRDPADLLDPAVDAGIALIEGPVVSFRHPLYGSALVAEAGPKDVRATHAWLGRSSLEDPEARVRHLALASEQPDADLADALASAAQRAKLRGAPPVAGELADLAVERTPSGRAGRDELALWAADAWFLAGDLGAARRRAAALVPAVGGTLRARALLLIGLADWFDGSSREAAAVLESALGDAVEDVALLGLIHYYLSIFVDYDIPAARRHALRAADLLDGTTDRGHLAAALLQAFHWTVVLGRRPPTALLRAGLEAEREGPLIDRLTSPGIWWAGIGRLAQARDRFQSLLDFDLMHGIYSNAPNSLTRLAEVAFWADDWPAARRIALEACDAALANGAPAEEMSLRTLALVDAAEGDLEEAVAAARAGIERTAQTESFILEAAWLHVLAMVGASQGDASLVEEVTGAAGLLLQRAGYLEPMRLDPSPERIEALASLGRLDEAVTVLAELEARHRRVAKPWAAAAIARGRARIALARGDPAAAIEATTVAAAGTPQRWSRFDLGRVLLVRGEAQRHARSRREAGETLARAEDLFAQLGATIWAKRAADEIARLGLKRSATLALTPTEARVARLVGQGYSTRAVAAELGISPRTVETHLASVYGKLGLSSRAELGRAMALDETP